MFNCYLKNHDRLTFNAESGFETAREAIEWGIGQSGYEYIIDIEDPDEDPDNVDPSTPTLYCSAHGALSVDVDESGSPYTWMPCKRRFLTVDEAAKLF